MLYHAFTSYSHGTDERLAPAIQSCLHRPARPFYRLRALNVFRDKTGLAARPALRSVIGPALQHSAHFILLASPVSHGSSAALRSATRPLPLSASFSRNSGSRSSVLGGGSRRNSWRRVSRRRSTTSRVACTKLSPSTRPAGRDVSSREGPLHAGSEGQSRGDQELEGASGQIYRLKV